MGRNAVGLIVSLWVIPISIMGNLIVLDPYMDEIFHVPQAQEYCKGDFRTWDPMITTPLTCLLSEIQDIVLPSWHIKRELLLSFSPFFILCKIILLYILHFTINKAAVEVWSLWKKRLFSFVQMLLIFTACFLSVHFFSALLTPIFLLIIGTNHFILAKDHKSSLVNEIPPGSAFCLFMVFHLYFISLSSKENLGVDIFLGYSRSSNSYPTGGI